MKRELIFSMFCFLSIISCEKEKSKPESDNNIADLELSLMIVHGNNQTGVYNSMLEDSLVVKVSDKEGNPVAQAPVTFQITSGSGDFSHDWVFTNSLGFAYVKWAIGCNSDYNELTAYLNDSVSNKIDSVTFTANASLPNGWGKSCGIEYPYQSGTVFREHNGTIYLANKEKIYTTNDGGISWQVYENMPPLSPYSNIFDIQFNSKGWMYVATHSDGIFYTENDGTWHQINNGILNYGAARTFLVEDTCLFISFYYDGLYRSTDNGKFWRKLLIDGKSNDEYVLINRHPNGNLYMFDKSDNFWHSTDNGDNWDRILLDYKYTNYEVEDFVIDNNGDLIIGAGDAKISVLSSETYQGTLHNYYKSNGWSQHIEDIKIINDIVYFIVNGTPEPGIYSSQNWARLDLGFENQIYTYHLNTDGTFLIASSDGIYYFNEQ